MNLFAQGVPVLMQTGVLDPVYDDLVVDNITTRSNLAAAGKEVVAFDLTMTNANTTSWAPAANTASASSAIGYFSNSVFGSVVLPPDDDFTTVSSVVRAKASNKVSIYGVALNSAAITAPGTTQVRIYGEQALVKAASVRHAAGSCFVATAGGTGTVTPCTTTGTGKKIIAIKSTADDGAATTALTAFFCGTGFGHDAVTDTDT